LNQWIGNRRDESRVPLSIAILVVPVEDGRPQVEDHFPTVTREFSTTGVSIILDRPRPLDKVILVFRLESELVHLQGQARHLSPMGAGFHYLGIELHETVHPGDLPELNRLIL